MADNAEQEGAEAPESGGEPPKTFTQEDIDKAVESRLARERKKFSDYDELKAKAEKLAEIEAANLSDLEKERAAREAAEARASELASKAEKAAVNAAIVKAAVAAGVKSTDAVLRAIDKTGLTVGDDGQVSGAEDAVKALLAEIPALVGEGTPVGDADQGARGGGPDQITQEQLSQMSPEEIAKALKDGKLSHLL
jgi:hypothetical protein